MSFKRRGTYSNGTKGCPSTTMTNHQANLWQEPIKGHIVHLLPRWNIDISNLPSPESQSQLPQLPALNSSSRIASPTPPPEKAKFEVTACTNKQGEVTAFNLWPKILKDWFANKKQMKIKNKKNVACWCMLLCIFCKKTSDHPRVLCSKTVRPATSTNRMHCLCLSLAIGAQKNTHALLLCRLNDCILQMLSAKHGSSETGHKPWHSGLSGLTCLNIVEAMQSWWDVVSSCL